MLQGTAGGDKILNFEFSELMRDSVPNNSILVNSTQSISIPIQFNSGFLESIVEPHLNWVELINWLVAAVVVGSKRRLVYTILYVFELLLL